MNYEGICKGVLELDQSIRYSGLVDHLGTLLSMSYRKGLEPLSSPEETAEYSRRAVLRTGAIESGPKVGKLEYVIGKYENLIRATIPIVSDQYNKYYLMLSIDKVDNSSKIIEEKVLPFVREEWRQFF
ncbi:MAG TPA: hypothetical protein VH415_10330 [Nitrososphaeraceae archaeon]